MKKVILLICLFYLTAQSVSAQSGILDHSFGNNGVVKANLDSPYNYNYDGQQVLIKPDGSIYTILHADRYTLVAKKHADGSVDKS